MGLLGVFGIYRTIGLYCGRCGVKRWMDEKATKQRDPTSARAKDCGPDGAIVDQETDPSTAASKSRDSD